jgi:hypothetical protein
MSLAENRIDEFSMTRIAFTVSRPHIIEERLAEARLAGERLAPEGPPCCRP